MRTETIRHTVAEIFGHNSPAIQGEMRTGARVCVRAQVVNTAHMVVMAMGKQCAGYIGAAYTQQLLTEIGAAVDQYVRRIRFTLEQRRSPQTLISRI